MRPVGPVFTECRFDRASRFAGKDRDHGLLSGRLMRQADRACTAERSDSGRSAAEDGGRRLFCFAMQSVRRDLREIVIPVIGRTRRKIAAERRCGPGPPAASVAHSEGRGRGPFRQNGKPHRTDTVRKPADRAHLLFPAAYSASANRWKSPGASCARNSARRRSIPRRRRSSLKSPNRDESTCTSMPASCALSAPHFSR